MRIRKKLVVPAACMAAMAVFGQGAANVGKTVDQLKKDISLGSMSFSDFRDKTNQKFAQVKTTSEQDKDMGFDGVMRFTVELTGNNGEVWYGQMSKPQGKRRADYTGEDYWEFNVSHGTLKYPEIVCAMEYGYQTSNAFVVVDQQCKKCESADEIMTRNKGSKNKLKITAKTRPEHEVNSAAGDGGGGE